MKTLIKNDRQFLGVWVSPDLAKKIDQAVQDMDLDRSKFVRHALNEKLTREKAAPGEHALAPC